MGGTRSPLKILGILKLTSKCRASQGSRKGSYEVLEVVSMFMNILSNLQVFVQEPVTESGSL